MSDSVLAWLFALSLGLPLYPLLIQITWGTYRGVKKCWDTGECEDTP